MLPAQSDGARGGESKFALPSFGAQTSSRAQAVADGKLLIPIAKRFPASEARQAHELAQRGAGGKVLLTF